MARDLTPQDTQFLKALKAQGVPAPDAFARLDKVKRTVSQPITPDLTNGQVGFTPEEQENIQAQLQLVGKTAEDIPPEQREQTLRNLAAQGKPSFIEKFGKRGEIPGARAKETAKAGIERIKTSGEELRQAEGFQETGAAFIEGGLGALQATAGAIISGALGTIEPEIQSAITGTGAFFKNALVGFQVEEGKSQEEAEANVQQQIEGVQEFIAKDIGVPLEQFKQENPIAAPLAELGLWFLGLKGAQKGGVAAKELAEEAVPKIVAGVEAAKPVVKAAGEAVVAGAEAVAPVAEAIVKAPFKATKAVVKGAADLPSQILGKTTGTSAETVRQAFRQGGTQEFKEALRGNISPEQVLQETKGALEAVRQSRKDLYGSGFKKIEANKKPLDITDIKNDFQKTLDDNKITIDDKGKLDFSQSKLRSTSQGITEIQNTFTDLNTWADTTPLGLDILKQRVREGFRGATDTGLSDRIHTQFANKIKDKIIKEVPDYANLNQNYEIITREIEDITRALSLGRKTSSETAVRKLNQALKENFTFRQDMVKLLEQYSGKNIQAQLAGAALNPALAKGLAGVVTGGGIVFGQLANPAFWAGLALASPRLIGELARATGVSITKVKQAIKFINEKVVQPVTKRIKESIPVIKGTRGGALLDDVGKGKLIKGQEFVDPHSRIGGKLIFKNVETQADGGKLYWFRKTGIGADRAFAEFELKEILKKPLSKPPSFKKAGAATSATQIKADNFQKLVSQAQTKDRSLTHLSLDELSKLNTKTVRDGQGGFALSSVDKNGNIELTNVFTLPTARGKGIGKEVMESAIEEARSLGAKSIKLDAYAYLRPFYEKSGFKVFKTDKFDTKRAGFDPRIKGKEKLHDIIFMQLNLK